MEDETMSVLPRILDPNMKFTAESIRLIPEKTKPEIANVSESENVEIKDEKQISEISLFFKNYKYIILTIIIIILLIILAYLIYKYMNKKKSLPDDSPPPVSKENPTINKETKEKIDNYISSYIIDETEEETDNTQNEPESDTNDDSILQTEPILEEETPVLFDIREALSSQMPTHVDVIIQEGIAISSDLNNNNRFEELSNLEEVSVTEFEDNKESENGSDTNESLDLNTIIDEIANQEPQKKNKKDKKKEIDHFKAYLNNSKN